jgi:hypothetical protein
MATLCATAQLSGPQRTSDNSLATPEQHSAGQAIAWARTGRGGRQFDMFRLDEGKQEAAPPCTSIYGLCE